MNDDALILFAHGARDPRWADPLRSVVERVRARAPGLRVELAFLELMQPSLPEAVAELSAEGIARITLVPAFLGQGGHIRRDLPLLLDELRRRHPRMRIELAPTVGEVDQVLDAIASFCVQSHYG
ncbi:sirohydrochlorin chelatase [Derxia gummosa]|uniref:Sirohydrochlorin chelatase n=1 Tax=Derxia gummosa DSM 723 TaxID=1121388 RepID=A0A8B6X7P2_9BURK|nr:CbiX/SirB N-terminal domain-containing protein [Derxia gummosa]